MAFAIAWITLNASARLVRLIQPGTCSYPRSHPSKRQTIRNCCVVIFLPTMIHYFESFLSIIAGQVPCRLNEHHNPSVLWNGPAIFFMLKSDFQPGLNPFYLSHLSVVCIMESMMVVHALRLT